MNWTDAQKKAIYDEGNLIVSAAAGSGKTAVLTERIVRLIKEGADVSDFLCVTFTNAAAAEMKKRVEKRLCDVAAEMEVIDDHITAERLYDAAENTPRASISTLHSFCGQVLRRHFHDADLDASFRIMDDAETLILKSDAMDALLEARYADESGMFSRLIDALGGEETAIDVFLSLYAFLGAQADPDAFIDNTINTYYDDAVLDSLLEACCHDVLGLVKDKLTSHFNRFSSASNELLGLSPKVDDLLSQELNSIDDLLRIDNYSAFRSAAAGFTFETLRFPPKTDPDTKSIVQIPRNKLKKFLRDICVKEMPFTFIEERSKVVNQRAYVSELFESIKHFNIIFAELKDKKNVIDYSDMEHMTLKLFQNDVRIRNEYRSRFKYVFVDEYQDTNEVQEAIILSVASQDNLFTVGDVKQSVYRFRMAEPKLFINRYDLFKHECGGRAIDLNSNFRSSNTVINVVNGIFSRIMNKQAAEIDYDDDAALVAGRTDSQGSVEFHLIDASQSAIPNGEDIEQDSDDQDDDEPLEMLSLAELEAQMAAKRIIDIINNERFFDPAIKQMREYKFSDFVVLLRTQKNVSDVWMDVLSRMGIPSYAETTGGYFDALEVRVLMDLLRIIDNRFQDIPLLSVLRSPIGGFSVNELAAMRIEFPAATLFDSLSAMSVNNEKAMRFIENINLWRRSSRLYSIEEFLLRLLDDTHYNDFASALPDGHIRRANINALVDRARSYEKSGIRGLHSFIGFMDRLKNTDKLGAARTANVDVVRIMSIHKSKGLEFPIVILGGLDKGFNFSDMKKHIVCSADMGIGLKLIDANISSDTLILRAINALQRNKCITEEMRLLYVALTRAKEKLILLCASKKAKKRICDCNETISNSKVRLSKKMSDWILGVLLSVKDGNPLRVAAGLCTVVDPCVSVLGINTSYECMSVSRFTFAKLTKKDFSEYRSLAAHADASSLYEKLNFNYSFAPDTLIPSKLSVTALSEHEVDVSREPDFISERKIRATSIGTAAHTLMQFITLNGSHTNDSVKKELDALIKAGIIDPQCAALINTQRIVSFFASDIGKRLSQSSIIRRELEFTYRIKAGRLIDTASDSYLLLQGIIDCCFVEDGKWIIMDYKTDRVPNGVSPYDVAKKHTQQLTLYAEALSSLTNMPVSEKYIFLLSIGEAVKI